MSSVAAPCEKHDRNMITSHQPTGPACQLQHVSMLRGITQPAYTVDNPGRRSRLHLLGCPLHRVAVGPSPSGVVARRLDRRGNPTLALLMPGVFWETPPVRRASSCLLIAYFINLLSSPSRVCRLSPSSIYCLTTVEEEEKRTRHLRRDLEQPGKTNRIVLHTSHK